MRLLVNINDKQYEKYYRVKSVSEAKRLIEERSINPIRCLLFTERAFETFKKGWKHQQKDDAETQVEYEARCFNEGIELCRYKHKCHWHDGLEAFH